MIMCGAIAKRCFILLDDDFVSREIRNFLEGRGWSLKDLSRHTGISYRALQEYTAGNSKPGFDQLRKFASVGMDVTFLLTQKWGG